MVRGIISGIILGFIYAFVVESISHFVLLIFSFLFAPSFPSYVGSYPYLSPLLSIERGLWGSFALQILVYVLWVWFGYELGEGSINIKGLKNDVYYVSIFVPVLVAVFSFIIDEEMLKISGLLLYSIVDVIRVYFSVAVLVGLLSGFTVSLINLIRK
ncbi:MAG: hypothetical protein ACP5GU_03530 [Thermoprotei archaeon]|jgi:hypothetical protein